MATNTQDFTDTSEGGAQRLTDAAGDIAQQATSVAEQRASSTMSQVGDSLQQVARVVRDAGDNLRSEQPQVASFADTAAQQVERAGQYLRERDAREVLDGFQDFARRQPAIVVGAGLALGLLVGRALKSANGSAGGTSVADQFGGQWNGGSRYAAPASYAGEAYDASRSYEASGGYNTLGDDTEAAASSTEELSREGDYTPSGYAPSSDTVTEGER
jgi:ElaB/YqjD/DUF883 family membrane-anchored ribosome-binding protein